MDYYLLTAEGRKAGPYSIDQMRSFWASGRIIRTTPMWAPGMTEWRSVGTIEFLLTPPRSLSQVPIPTPNAKPRGLSWGRGLLAGCLVLFALPVGLVVVLAALANSLGTAQPAGTTTNPIVWPPTVIEISDKIYQNGNHANFALCSWNLIAENDKENAAIVRSNLDLNALPGSPEAQEEVSKKCEAAGVALEDQYLRDGRAVLLPAGEYRITGFYNCHDGSVETMDSDPAMVMVSVTFNGKPVFVGMLTSDIWQKYHEQQHPIPSIIPPDHLTKDEWKKAVPENAGLVGFGRIACNKAALFSAVGSPSRTEAAGDDEDLFWDCSDGTIEVVCARGQYELGLVGGSVNEY